MERREFSELPEINELHKSDDRPTVLVIDDVPFRMPFYKKVLLRLNANAVFSNSVTHASRELQRRNFALILVNNEMTGELGKNVVEAVRVDPKKADIPIIVVTSERSEAAICRFIDYGFDHFVFPEDLGNPDQFQGMVGKLTDMI